MPRSLKKGPYIDPKLEKKVKEMGKGSKKTVIKTWSRRSTISPSFVGYTFAVHNGIKFIPVYISENHGQSFIAMNSGLPNTLVFQLAGTPDDAILFAATEIGPYAYSRSEDEWFLLSGISAPDQTYWTVDYVPEINTARFGTYGRGIWDFVLNENYQNYLGDVNNDLIINIQDVILVISFILGNNIPTTQEFINSDLNEDNQINILDIVTIINMIFSATEYNEIADMNSDSIINVLDVVLLVNLVLDN